MQFINKAIITVTIVFSIITFSQADTAWITKKKDKSNNIEKTEKKKNCIFMDKKKERK